MANYQLLNVESNNKPSKCYIERTFVDLNYNVTKENRTEFNEGGKQSQLVYRYNAIRVRNGQPEKDELIRFLIHTEFTLDDEIALINNRESNENEYNEYIARRNELKELAKELYEEYERRK